MTRPTKKKSDCAANAVGAPASYPPLIRKHLPRLCVLARARPGQARRMIASSPASFLKCLSLIAWNLTQETVPLKRRERDKLTPYSRHILKLSRKSLSTAERRKTLNQRAGFIGALISVLSSAVLPAIIGAVQKK